VLLVTSVGSPTGGVTPVLAALEAAGAQVRAIDVGRAGSRPDGALDKVLQALAGEVAERRLLRELDEHPPDVTIAFDPATAAALSLVRDQGRHSAPVIAVVAELQPEAAWAATDADRYLTIDEEAAVELAEHGVEGERIIPIGPLCEWAFVEAAQESRDDLRQRYRIEGGAPVVVVNVDGFGYESTSQIALQLSLIGGNASYLFDAGNDVDAATALRRQVPTMDIRAKLFGRTPDAPRYWRCADVVVARPTPLTVARCMVLGSRMVSFLPEGREANQLAKALEARNLGTTAGSILLLSSALEPLLGRPVRADQRLGVDGAATVADIAWIVGSERRDVIAERRAAATESTRARVEAAASAAEAAARSTAAAGGLEDLSDAASVDAAPPDPKEISALRTEVRMRLAQVGKTVSEARESGDRWHERAEQARSRGDDAAAREAERQADAERARMHAALAEMAQLQAELERLEKAAAAAPPPRPSSASRPAGASSGARASAPPPPPPRSSVDDLLDQMKRQQGGPHQQQRRPAGSSGSKQSARPDDGPRTIDDELAALKRKMEQKKKK
jgi:UDP-N-acetylglucosamine:LPS N-acetylglucosamine transferase